MSTLTKSKEEVQRIMAVLKKVTETATITHQEKNDIEQIMTQLTGDNWKGKCLSCSPGNILLILRTYYDRLVKEEKESTKPQEQTIVVDPVSNADQPTPVIIEDDNKVIEDEPQSIGLSPAPTTGKKKKGIKPK